MGITTMSTTSADARNARQMHPPLTLEVCEEKSNQKKRTQLNPIAIAPIIPPIPSIFTAPEVGVAVGFGGCFPDPDGVAVAAPPFPLPLPTLVGLAVFIPSLGTTKPLFVNSAPAGPAAVTAPLTGLNGRVRFSFKAAVPWSG